MKTIWIVVATAVVIALIVGIGGYFLMKNKTTNEKKDLQSQIDNLNKELSDLKTKSSSSTSASTSSSSGSSSSANKNTHTDNDAYFAVTLPDDWEVKSSYYYETAGGEKAKVPTVILGRKSDTSEENTNKININPRQSSCDQLSPIPDRTEPAGSQSVKVYIANESDTFCVSTEVEGKDNTGKKAIYQFVSFYDDTSVKDAFKTIVGSFKVL